MTTLQALHFTDAALLPALQQLSDADLDALEFGVIGIDACGASASGVSRADYAGKTAIPFRGGSAAITVLTGAAGSSPRIREVPGEH